MDAVPKSRIRIHRSSFSPMLMMRYLSFLMLSMLLFSSRTVEASKQREETDEPIVLPLPEPTASPTRGPTETPTTKSPTSIPTMEPTTSSAPTTLTKSPSLIPTTSAPTGSPISEDLYTLDLPDMELTFTMASGTSLTPVVLQKDWQSFLTTVLQVAIGATVDEWTVWDSDVLYTTTTGVGIARASGQVAVSRGRGRRLQQDITQATLETELYDYFFVWGMDEIWEYFVARGYPMTSLTLDFLEDSFQPRRAEPEGLTPLRAPAQERNDDKRNAWIAGVIMGGVVVIVASVVALLYLQRRGDHSVKASAASSPRTMAVSEVPSPQKPEQNNTPLPFGRDMDIMVRKNMIVGGTQMEDISAVPSFSESSFCYDASRLDQVIDSARGYELPYTVPNHTFSDLTNEVKDITNNDEDEEEDTIVKETQQGNTAPKARDAEVVEEAPANRELFDKDPSFQATHFEDIPVGTDPSSRATPYNDIPFGNSDFEFLPRNAELDIHYSPSLFDDDDEKKETETKR
eukprot:scaffold8204_cov177-Amphora_coffeaeformis.AAC.8